MLFHQKKTVILIVAMLTVFLLAGSAMRGRYHFPIMERVVNTALSPFDYVFTKLGGGIQHSTSFIGQLFTLYRDNQRLRAENEDLQQNNVNMVEIQAENERLRSMLNYKKRAPQFDFLTASVIARDPGSWTSTITINRGTNDGVTKDMPVVTAQGLVGNVIQVGSNYAKVQLMLDPRSAVGALVQRPESRVAGIINGQAATPMSPHMVNLARDADVLNGDRIITSGFGGIYPRGLLIGEVVDVVNDDGGLLKYAILKPAVDFDRLEEVMVIIGSREPIPTLAPVPVVQTQAADAAKKVKH